MEKYKLEDIPKNYEDSNESIMSNFDSIIDKEIENKLLKENLYASYPGWNFYGTVWFNKDNNKWYCKINQYRSHTNTIISDTTEEIMKEACDLYGYE